MTTVTATLQISFERDDADGEDGVILRLEVDDRDDGLNAGDTSFRPGDDVYYLMYLTGASLQQHFATAGAISSEGGGGRVIADDDAEYLTFSEAKEASLGYPASGGLTSSAWIGNVYDLNGNQIAAPTIELVDGGSTIRTAEKVTGILKLEYIAPYTAYRLSGVPLDVTRAMVFAQAAT